MNEIELEKQVDKSDGTNSECDDGTKSFSSQEDYKVDLKKGKHIVTGVASVNLYKESNNNNHPLPPPGMNYNNDNGSDTDSTNSDVGITESHKATLAGIEEYKRSEEIKKEKRKKLEDTNDKNSLRILLLGFLFPFIWGFGFKYIHSYGKAKKYAIASVILFGTVCFVIVAGVPLLAIGLTVGFKRKTCRESSCEYYSDDDYYY